MDGHVTVAVSLGLAKGTGEKEGTKKAGAAAKGVWRVLSVADQLSVGWVFFRAKSSGHPKGAFRPVSRAKKHPGKGISEDGTAA